MRNESFAHTPNLSEDITAMATELSVGEQIAKASAANGPCFCDRSTGGTLIESHMDGKNRIDRIRCESEACGLIWKRIDVGCAR